MTANSRGRNCTLKPDSNFLWISTQKLKCQMLNFYWIYFPLQTLWTPTIVMVQHHEAKGSWCKSPQTQGGVHGWTLRLHRHRVGYMGTWLDPQAPQTPGGVHGWTLRLHRHRVGYMVGPSGFTDTGWGTWLDPQAPQLHTFTAAIPNQRAPGPGTEPGPGDRSRFPAPLEPEIWNNYRKA